MPKRSKPTDITDPTYLLLVEEERAGHTQFGAIEYSEFSKLSPAQQEELKRQAGQGVGHGSGRRGRMRSHPLLDKKRYFSGIDKNYSGRVGDSKQSVDKFNKEQELQYQKRLEKKQKLQNRIKLTRT